VSGHGGAFKKWIALFSPFVAGLVFSKISYGAIKTAKKCFFEPFLLPI
jgi:hypothetical protein